MTRSLHSTVDATFLSLTGLLVAVGLLLGWTHTGRVAL